MYKTSKDAKYMLCPNNIEYLSKFSGLKNGKCIADECMAWRTNGGRSWGAEGEEKITEGYCGKYGMPFRIRE